MSHRAEAVACGTTSPVFAAYADAGAHACTADTDCAGAQDNLFRWCRQGTCAPDQCLLDSDCPAGSACGCMAQLGGGDVAVQGNYCVKSTCRVDSDCGPGGFCSPTGAAYDCSPFIGYFCHGAADTCVNDADCLCDSGPNTCLYDAAVGHWHCAAILVCR